MKIILLNGPPRCGKNTAARMLSEMAGDGLVLGFSHHLKRMVHGIYFGRRGWDMDPDEFDAIKDEPQEMLGGRSWRQIYIHFSEHVIKPLHGEEWFGDRFMQTARESGAETVFVPDSGFRGEGVRVVRDVGAENVLLVQIKRDGCSYAGDSRSYIDLRDMGVRMMRVENLTNRPDFLRRRMGAALELLQGAPAYSDG